MSDLRRKQADRTAETKRALKEAFCRLFAEKPLDKISIVEVCRLAGYNRSTFYQYYLSLDDILLEVENETLDYILKHRAVIHTSDFNFIKELASMYESKKLYMDAMLGENSTPRFLERLVALSTEHIPDLGLDKDDPHLPYLIEYRYNGVLSLLRLWLRRGRDLPFEDFLEMIRTLYYSK